MITQYDFTRIGLDVEYVYYLNEEEQPRTYLVFSTELLNFIREEGLADHITNDEYERIATEEEAWDYLIDYYPEVAAQYWQKYLEGELDDEN